MKPFDRALLETSVRNILIAIGDDPDREGLQETPARVASAYEEMFSSLHQKAFTESKVFNSSMANDGELVVVADIPFYSMCEHHLLPFFGSVSVGYMPKNGRIIGLSKIPRLVDYVAKKPNVQENLTSQIGLELQKLVDPQGVAVVVKARHMCTEMRGIKKANSHTLTSFFSGAFKNKDYRMEFLQEIKNQ
ncbi:GTP cyclohydrolase I [Lacticaseibacillus zeae DSM 20178 = KCTC 3804]|uniref:GTP cyclohydrolase 1 n=2 Tax=Lacticaseibacillus zeae TaxID=57037 RepID=A0A5R8LQJ1_LACZE|nr:GTP cyclohydrolase I FolE [Lacticaseibacillus zeae]KRK12247.1 GTP cyclohydrolase I [Lacticaseibacillus zeae DSM 20178 = KCTC 3804]OLS09574.1 GTP cyclohydrolase [Lacticaseibacillus casei]QVI31089.1 GTP cyclohydrolase I FolE [Lacticaseibacillus zeae]TLF39492.1 GTP cyclohydrolase I FolE [Lacticaseibacillus zeae]